MPRKPKWVCNPKNKQNWTKKDRAFIKMMEQYENNDAISTNRAKKQKEVWREISTRVGMPAEYCRRKWTGIKHNYLKLKYMIHGGIVTEDMVREHIKTSKYLEGRLDFLDRYMFIIPEKDFIPSAHDFFESAFEISSYTQSGSSVEKLIKVKENSVIEVIKDYKQEIGTEPMSILPNIDNYESGSSITHFKETFVNLEMDEAKEVYGIDDDLNNVVFVEPAILPDIQISTSVKEEFVNLGMDPAIKEGYRIHEDLNDEQFVAPDMLPNIQIEQAVDPIGDNMVTDVTNSSILKDILMTTKNEEKKSTKSSSQNTCDLAKFLVKYATKTKDTEKDKDCNLKKYMDDLAEVLCRRLIPEKRKYFLSRVDLIVSEILEGT